MRRKPHNYIGSFTGRMLLLAGLLLFFVKAFSQEIPARPNPARAVNDFAGILDPDQVNTLEKNLEDFYDSTSNAIVVVTVNDLGDYDKAQFAYEIGQQWGVGKKGFDNGIVILIKPKRPDAKGDVFIATGYGLEGAIPDATSKLIVENEMIPRFKKNDYYGGITAAVNILKGLASGEFNAAQYKKKANQTKGWAFLVPLAVFIILYLIFRNGKNNHNNIGSKNIPFWTWLILLNSMGGRGGGGWGGGSGGFGGGGGGFGGFGGGGFGGGGAGGSW